MGLGDRIREFAKARFKTQSKFATEVGMAEQAISNLINGRQLPSTETLQRFAAVGMNVNWLLTGDGPMSADIPLVEVVNEPDAEAPPPKKKMTREEMIAFHTIDDGGRSKIPLSSLAEVTLARLRVLRQKNEAEMLELRRREDEELAKIVEVLASGKGAA